MRKHFSWAMGSEAFSKIAGLIIMALDIFVLNSAFLLAACTTWTLPLRCICLFSLFHYIGVDWHLRFSLLHYLWWNLIIMFVVLFDRLFVSFKFFDAILLLFWGPCKLFTAHMFKALLLNNNLYVPLLSCRLLRLKPPFESLHTFSIEKRYLLGLMLGSEEVNEEP